MDVCYIIQRVQLHYCKRGNARLRTSKLRFCPIIISQTTGNCGESEPPKTDSKSSIFRLSTITHVPIFAITDGNGNCT